MARADGAVDGTQIKDLCVNGTTFARLGRGTRLKKARVSSQNGVQLVASERRATSPPHPQSEHASKSDHGRELGHPGLPPRPGSVDLFAKSRGMSSVQS